MQTLSHIHNNLSRTLCIVEKCFGMNMRRLTFCCSKMETLSHASLYIHVELIENRSHRIQCSRLFIKVPNLYNSAKVWIHGWQINILKWSQCTSLMLNLSSVTSHLLTKTMLYNKDCKALTFFRFSAGKIITMC